MATGFWVRRRTCGTAFSGAMFGTGIGSRRTPAALPLSPEPALLRGDGRAIAPQEFEAQGHVGWRLDVEGAVRLDRELCPTPPGSLVYFGTRPLLRQPSFPGFAATSRHRNSDKVIGALPIAEAGRVVGWHRTDTDGHRLKGIRTNKLHRLCCRTGGKAANPVR